MKKLFLMSVSAFWILGCGGDEFTALFEDNQADAADSGTEQDAPKHDVTVEEPYDGQAETSDAHLEHKADAPSKEAEAGEDVIADVIDAAAEEADAPEEPQPVGPCGPIPSVGWWFCYALEHPDSGTLLLGLAGAIVKPGDTTELKWADPFSGKFGHCIAPTPLDDFVLCALEDLGKNWEISFAPGPHAHINASTTPPYACGSTCPGKAAIYHDGKTLGGLAQETPTGILTYVAHYNAPSRNDLFFKVP